jgi:hypothetical protein
LPIVARDVSLVLLLLNKRGVRVTRMTMTHGEDLLAARQPLVIIRHSPLQEGEARILTRLSA